MKCIKDIPINKITIGSRYRFINEHYKECMWNGVCKSQDILEVMFVRNAEPANMKQYILFKNCTNSDGNDCIIYPKDGSVVVSCLFYDDSIQQPNE
jgi:hypothetical protein